MRNHILRLNFFMVGLCVFITIKGNTRELTAQEWVRLDSVVYYDSSADKANPYADSIVSREMASYDSSGSTIVDVVRTLPVIVGVGEHGDSLALMPFIRSRSYIPQSFSVLLELDVNWEGEIRRATVLQYRGEGFSEFPFRKFIQSLRVGVSYRYGFPSENKIVIPVIRKK
ncbi:MAG TPA: hypothetical protein VII11_09980 [Bacteroidota bacterium]